MSSAPHIPETILVSVFPAAPGGGNPAPIVPDARGLTGEAMHLIAAHHGRESAFVLPPEDSASADRRLRFFVTAAPARRVTTQYWTSMDDKDHVFARFKDDKPAASDRREMLSIPRRGNAMGSRAVEVVHVRSSGAPTGKGQPRRLTFTDRAATWAHGFPARSPAQLPAMVDAGAPVRAEPVTHVMPMWEPAAVAAEVTLPVCDEAPAASASSAAEASHPRTRKLARRVADPFDATDDRANCMRCGYAIEPTRQKRGLMTCSECG